MKTHELENGDVFEGFINMRGKRKGEGKLTKKDGTIYEANFVDDQFSG